MKRREAGRWDLAWGGIASLGLALPVLWTVMRQRGLNTDEAAARVAKWMATRPSQLAGLLDRKGSIAVGVDADIAVFDAHISWTVTPNDLHFRYKISPYLGAKLGNACGRKPGYAARLADGMHPWRCAGPRAGAHVTDRPVGY